MAVICDFLDTLNQPVTSYSTIYPFIFLNYDVKLTTPSVIDDTLSVLKHNDTVLGYFTSQGTSIFSDFDGKNRSIQVEDGDEFTVHIEGSGINFTKSITVSRPRLDGVKTIPELLRTVCQYEASGVDPKELRLTGLCSYLNELYDLQSTDFPTKSWGEVYDTFKKRLVGIPREGDLLSLQDAFTVTETGSRTIGATLLLANDMLRQTGDHFVKNNNDLKILSVDNAQGGSVSTTVVNGDITSITYNCNVGLGYLGSFSCHIQKKDGTGPIYEVPVKMIIKPKPAIVPEADIYSVTQHESVSISKDDLLSNDESTYMLSFVEFTNVTGGTVVDHGDVLEFTSTDFAGQPAGFQYLVKDTQDNYAYGDVTIDVEELPEVEAYIFPTDGLEDFKTVYTPPSQETIFNQWSRISADDYWNPSYGGTPSGELAAWELNNGHIRCTTNSHNFVGFISPEHFNNYRLDTVLSSTDDDDDLIAVILATAHKSIGQNFALIAWREPGGFVQNSATGDRFGISVVAGNDYTPIVSTTPMSDGTRRWYDKKTRLKCVRNGDIFTVSCSPFFALDDPIPEIDPATALTVNARDIPECDWMYTDSNPTAKRHYGYGCHSQKYAAFEILSFEGGLVADKIYNADTGEIWMYENENWVLSSETIQEQLGYPRTVTNPDTGISYRILENSIIQL